MDETGCFGRLARRWEEFLNKMKWSKFSSSWKWRCDWEEIFSKSIVFLDSFGADLGGENCADGCCINYLQFVKQFWEHL